MAYWIFKYDPKVYRLEDRFRDPNPTLDWRVPQYADVIKPGDIAFLWRTRSRRGIVRVMGVGTKLGRCSEGDDLRDYPDPNSGEAKRIWGEAPRVGGLLILRDLDLRMERLRAEPGLEGLTAFQPGRVATVFPVTDEEGAILAKIAGVPPLRVDEGNVFRVGESRISLDLVVDQSEKGMKPEEIVSAYDTLLLADVNAVISYYRQHRDEVRAYLEQRAAEADALKKKIEAEHPRISREELVARR